MKDWQQAAEANSPQSVRDAIIYAVAAVLLVVGFFVMRFTLASVADDAAAEPKTKATPCRTR
ncbi:MAG: hypothetical protein L0Y71_18535 [Gemmataceae bacterium]|nr:hypothetical protein [Gemmataceae bacterium]